MIEKTCPVCERKFSVQPCRAKRITCSRECRRARKPDRGIFQSRTCEACQQEFTPVSGAQICCKTCVPTHAAGVYWRLFKLTWPAYEAMLTSQGHACKICRVPFAQLPKNQVHVDHNHETNRVRGVLCQRCNLFVGMVESGRQILQTIVEYIDEL